MIGGQRSATLGRASCRRSTAAALLATAFRLLGNSGVDLAAALSAVAGCGSHPSRATTTPAGAALGSVTDGAATGPAFDASKPGAPPGAAPPSPPATHDVIVPQVLAPLEGIAERTDGLVLAWSRSRLYVLDPHTWQVRAAIPIAQRLQDAITVDKLVRIVTADVSIRLDLASGAQTRIIVRQGPDAGARSDHGMQREWRLTSGASIVQTDSTAAVRDPAGVQIAALPSTNSRILEIRERSADAERRPGPFGAWSAVTGRYTEGESSPHSLDQWDLATGRLRASVKRPRKIKPGPDHQQLDPLFRCDVAVWSEHPGRPVIRVQRLWDGRIVQQLPEGTISRQTDANCSEVTLVRECHLGGGYNPQMVSACTTVDIDPRSGKILRRGYETHHKGRPYSSGDGRWSPDKSIVLERVDGATQISLDPKTPLLRLDVTPRAFSFSGDSQRLAMIADSPAGKGTTLMLWSRAEPTSLRRLAPPNRACGAAFSNDATLLFLTPCADANVVSVIRVSDGAYLEHGQASTGEGPIGFFVSGMDWGGDDAADRLLLVRSGPDVATAPMVPLGQSRDLRRIDTMLEAFARGETRGNLLPEAPPGPDEPDAADAGGH